MQTQREKFEEWFLEKYPEYWQAIERKQSGKWVGWYKYKEIFDMYKKWCNERSLNWEDMK